MSLEFYALYSDMGQRSIAPEQCAVGAAVAGYVLLQSERQLVEQIGNNLLFRYFVG